jgi:N-acetylglucosamine-6-phosphate deacetylase
LGVTAWQPASGSIEWSALVQVAQRVADAMTASENRNDVARVLGVYFEGPFKHPASAGAAMRSMCLPPTAENVQRAIAEFGDAVRMITVSPGLDGDVDAIRQLVAAGKVVTISHSAAGYERVVACIEAGATVVGHIWNNNCGALIEPGVKQPTMETVALIDKRVRSVHLVCDGVHVHPTFVKLVHQCRGESITLISDAQAVAELPEGTTLVLDDGQSVCRAGNAARGVMDNSLFGSGCLLPTHFRNYVQYTGEHPAKAIRTVTHNPARSMGYQGEIGMIIRGRVADLVAWDSDLRITHIWKGGRAIEPTRTQ